MSHDRLTLLLRLAGPLQSWGTSSQFNRRESGTEPSKAGVVGLLAAAAGKRRTDDISELAALSFAVRVDQQGSLLRDYHTVSDYRGGPLLSASVDAKGRQRRTSPAKQTAVTHRYYLQDAVFVAAVSGPGALVETLSLAVQRPAFPLALGRRACAPGRPLFIGMTPAMARDALGEVPWQAAEHARRRLERERGWRPRTVHLVASADAERGQAVADVPRSFDPKNRSFSLRHVEHFSVEVPSGFEDPHDGPEPSSVHDPFELLGW